MKYSAGYKYQLRETFYYQCKYIRPYKEIKTKWIALDRNGLLTIIEGYAWDGASGPTIDTKSSMRGGLVHDALFQLMRFGLLDRNLNFHWANKEFHKILIEDGMYRWRAWIWYNSVGDFSKFATYYSSEPKILAAP